MVISVTVPMGPDRSLHVTAAAMAASPLVVRHIRSLPANTVAGVDASMARGTTGLSPRPRTLFGGVPCAASNIVPPSLLRWMMGPLSHRTAQIVHGSVG